MPDFPDLILEDLRAIHPKSTESSWYAPYTSLLAEWFPIREGFLVEPQTLNPGVKYPSAVNQIEFLVVKDQKRRPVLWLQLKRYSGLQYDSKRIDADKQIRERLNDSRKKCLLPNLHGMCAFGHMLCLYKFNPASKTWTPPRIAPNHDEYNEDLAPEERWNINLFRPDGRAEFGEFIEAVKSECAAALVHELQCAPTGSGDQPVSRYHSDPDCYIDDDYI